MIDNIMYMHTTKKGILGPFKNHKINVNKVWGNYISLGKTLVEFLLMFKSH